MLRLRSAIARENFNPTRPLVMDACATLGVLSLNGIFAADRVLIPVSAEYLAVKSALRMDKTLQALEPVLKQRIERRYVLTRFDARRKMARDVDSRLRERFGAEVCETRISENVSLAESPSFNCDVFTHAPKSRGAKDYANLLEELVNCGFLRFPADSGARLNVA